MSGSCASATETIVTLLERADLERLLGRGGR